MIVLDTRALVKLTTLEPKEDDDALRLRGLLQQAADAGLAIGVPAPVYAEFLVRADDATTDMLAAFEKKALLRILPFDKRAAHECALLDRVALSAGDKKGGNKAAPWQKVKIDRQIIAIARVHAAKEIITDDGDLTTLANRVGLSVRGVEALPIPEPDRQHDLPLPAPAKADQ